MSTKKQDPRELSLVGGSARKGMKSSSKPKRSPQWFNPGLYITRQLAEDDVLLIKQVYDSHDSNGTGLLTPNDLKQALFNLGFYTSKETVYNLIAECDEEGLGGLTFDSFIRVIGSNPSEIENSNDLRKLFRKYDRDNKGYLVAADLLAVAKSLSQPMTQQQSKNLFQTLDQKNKGRIEFQEFCLLMHHPDSLK